VSQSTKPIMEKYQ